MFDVVEEVISDPVRKNLGEVWLRSDINVVVELELSN